MDKSQRRRVLSPDGLHGHPGEHKRDHRRRVREVLVGVRGDQLLGGFLDAAHVEQRQGERTNAATDGDPQVGTIPKTASHAFAEALDLTVPKISGDGGPGMASSC